MTRTRSTARALVEFRVLVLARPGFAGFFEGDMRVRGTLQSLPWLYANSEACAPSHKEVGSCVITVLLVGRVTEALPLLEQAKPLVTATGTRGGQSLRVGHVSEAYLLAGRTSLPAGPRPGGRIRHAPSLTRSFSRPARRPPAVGRWGFPRAGSPAASCTGRSRAAPGPTAPGSRS